MDNQRISMSLFSIISGFAMSFITQYGMLSLLVCSVILLDIITGLLKAQISHSISSSFGFKGFWKKLSLLVGLSFGYFLDFFETYLLSINSAISLSLEIPFGTMIGVYIIFNESISVLENLCACGVKLPSFLSKSLKAANDQLDEGKLKK